MPFDLDDRTFWLATESEIRAGRTTDAYFATTRRILDREPEPGSVVMEVYASGLPYDEPWAVLLGVYEVGKLLEGRPVDVWAYDEGSVFLADSRRAVYEPVLQIEGRYAEFAEYETAILGFLASASSVATRAARFRRAAGGRLLLSFGTRRVHPALAPLVERACYLAGFDGVSNVAAAGLLRIPPTGTMPHALVQVFGDGPTAWRRLDDALEPGVPRVVLVDTFCDEKRESVEALATLGERLWGVRLDTPSSRRGDFRRILEEVRWELDARGAERVKLVASGRLDEREVERLRDLVDGFGVGTAVAYPPVIDFSAKIVEVRVAGRREFRAKRGGLGGRKQVYRAPGTLRDVVRLAERTPPVGMVPLLRPLLRQGRFVRRYEGLRKLRARVSEGVRLVDRGIPDVAWRASPRLGPGRRRAARRGPEALRPDERPGSPRGRRGRPG